MMTTPLKMPSSSPSSPCPISYVSVVLSSMGGGAQPSSPVFPATAAHESAAITLYTTARRRKRPRRRPGRRNVPRAPNPPDEAFPSHPLPTMGGASMPTTTHVMSARANDRDHCLKMSSPTLPLMALPSPSHQPFTVEGGNCTDILLPPRKSSRQRHCPRRVCRRHGPRAPNLQESPCGCRHQPQAPNISPKDS